MSNDLIDVDTQVMGGAAVHDGTRAPRFNKDQVLAFLDSAKDRSLASIS